MNIWISPCGCRLTAIRASLPPLPNWKRISLAVCFLFLFFFLIVRLWWTKSTAHSTWPLPLFHHWKATVGVFSFVPPTPLPAGLSRQGVRRDYQSPLSFSVKLELKHVHLSPGLLIIHPRPSLRFNLEGSPWGTSGGVSLRLISTSSPENVTWGNPMVTQ